MSWTASLIRVREFEIEQLRKRMKAVNERRVTAEMAIAVLDAEAEAETAHAARDAEAGWYLIGFRDGWKLRKAKAESELRACEAEERGCRDALSEAYVELKKIEQIAEQQASAAGRLAARREIQALDEIALRRTGT